MRLAVEMRFKVSVAVGMPFKVSSKLSVGYRGKSAVMSVTREVINVCRSAGSGVGAGVMPQTMHLANTRAWHAWATERDVTPLKLSHL